MKIVHLSTVTKGAYLTNADKTLTLWLTSNPDIDPDDSKYFNTVGRRDLTKFREDWEQCERQLVVQITKDEESNTEEVTLDDRGFPIFTVQNDELTTKPIVFESYNSLNAGITDMYLAVDNNICRWAILNDLNQCIGCEGFGDVAGSGEITDDPYILG